MPSRSWSPRFEFAAFCCASLGIVPTVRHADYIGSWLEVLREDNRAIVRAASQASKAADYLLGFRCPGPLTHRWMPAAAADHRDERGLAALMTDCFVTGWRSRESLSAARRGVSDMAICRSEDHPQSSSRDIPFNKLVLSQSNVRRVKAGVSIEDLAESIARSARSCRA
jgi:hypothetical protein